MMFGLAVVGVLVGVIAVARACCYAARPPWPWSYALGLAGATLGGSLACGALLCGLWYLTDGFGSGDMSTLVFGAGVGLLWGAIGGLVVGVVVARKRAAAGQKQANNGVGEA